MPNADAKNSSNRKTYIITGPTSGIGRATALELAKHGTVVLVGRDPAKLDDVQKIIQQRRQHAVSVVCDLSDPASVRRAVAEIVALQLPIVGLLNNAGIMQIRPTKNALGWDMSFATNHLGPFVLTEALVPHLSDGANVVFIASAAEDPEQKPAVAAGFRGSRYISSEASARGEWAPGGSSKPGFDAYATSKQCNLATMMVFSRETPRLRFNAVEPGFNPTTGLGGGDLGASVRFLQRYIIPLLVPLLMPFIKVLSTPKRAARVITKILINASGQTGVYYDAGGHPMSGSTLVRDPKFQDRVVSETRALLATFHHNPMQQKRTYIVTGGNAGLGLECVRNLATIKNSTTIVACRNLESGEAAVGDIKRSGADVRVMHLDFSSLASVRSFVSDFKKLNGLSLGAIVCNAGLQEIGKPSRTQDGFETTFGVNYLGHFVLTQLLLPFLEPSGRIVLVSSGTHDPEEKTGMPVPVYTNAEQLAGDLTPGAVNGRRRYSTSKLLMIYYMHELTKRLEMSNDPRLNSIRVNTFDPGLMPGTGLARQYPAPVRFLWNYVLPILAYFHRNVHTPKTSGKRLAQMASAPVFNGTNQYFSDGREKRSSVLSYNPKNEKDLWNTSLKLTNLPNW